MTTTDAVLDEPGPDGEEDGAGADRAGGPKEPADLLGLLAVAGAGLLPVVLVDDLYWGTWAPKAALCLVLLFPGLVALGRLVVSGSRPAVLAAAFLATACVSTALSDRPALSLFGAANWGTGLLFLATLAGSWALGTLAGDRRRRQLVVVILGAVIVNALVAWSQARVGTGGRTRGLMGNPVYLGGLVAGGLFLLGRRFGRERRSWWWLAAVALVAGAAQLSGGRAAVALSLLALLASLRGAGVVRGAALVAAVAVGVTLAPVGAKAPELASTRAAPATVVSRNDTRFAVWRVSLGAIGERPLVGWGPGRFPTATGPRYNAVAAQEGVVLKDAHNWVVENAVTTGLVGVALLLAWLAAAAWGARGPLAGFALVVAASSLVQPMHVALTPMAMVALGAAGTGNQRPRRAGDPVRGGGLGRGWSAAAVVGLGGGLVLALVLMTGQWYLQRGVQGDSLSDIRRAAALSPPWPELEVKAADAEADLGLDEGEPHKQRTLEHARRAVLRDPTDPALWASLGALELDWGTNPAAATAFRHALKDNPWDISSLLGRVTLAGRQGDQAGLAEGCRRLRVLGHASSACAAPPR